VGGKSRQKKKQELSVSTCGAAEKKAEGTQEGVSIGTAPKKLGGEPFSRTSQRFLGCWGGKTQWKEELGKFHTAGHRVKGE